MTREELIKKVALKMDEISSSDDVIVPVGTGDNNPLYTQINSLLNESVNDVLMKAPIYRLHNHTASLNTGIIDLDNQWWYLDILFNNTRTALVMEVPKDFIRLVSITDPEFERPIVDLAIEGDDIANRQHNKHLVAKTAKPVAVIGNGKNGRKITCYSFPFPYGPDTVFVYVKRYDNDKDATAESGLDEYMIDVVSWVCAGRVFAAQGDANKAKICDDNASALMI